MNRLSQYFAISILFVLASDSYAQPALTIQHLTNANFRLSWPAPSTGFTLEETLGLEESSAWQLVSASPLRDTNQFVLTLLPAGTNRFFRLRYLEFTNPPPDPAQLAPQLSRAETTSMADGTAFLYSGSNTVQIGVAPGTIEASRVAVLRGRVTQTSGAGLPGVLVTVLNHPEFGATATRADGMFDMAVNGGSRLCVVLDKPGFCQVQRDVVVPWQDFLCLPDVVMMTMDARSTSVAFGTNAPQQVHQASVVTDRDGTRCATILFPTGTCANARMPDGTLLPCSNLTVRATEFTVGTNGPAAMPAGLPPTSRYTYCVELSGDEAVASGATSVEFSQDLFCYVENFVGYDVGAAVPSGHYDRDRGFWVPEANGRIIKIVGQTSGLAEIDSNGDGSADDALLLAQRGFTDAERQRLSLLYTNGQELWRIPVRHFTAYDFNFNAVDADPNRDKPRTAQTLGTPTEDKPQVDCPASSLEIENQVLGELIPLVGTPFTLHYASDRTPGYLPARKLRIPLSGPIIASDLTRLEAEVEVGGRVFTQTFPPQTNLTHEFNWDGLDAYSRLVQGKVRAMVRIRHVVPEARLLIDRPREEMNSFGIINGVPLQRGHSRADGVIQQEVAQTIGAWDARGHGGLGGWTLSEHHAYDPVGKTIYMGDGTRRNAENLSDIVQTYAGTGASCPPGQTYCFDGQPARNTPLGNVSHVAAAPDGSVYVVHANNVISRITPDGIIRRFAGGGSNEAEGAPATEAHTVFITDIAIAPDGSVYFALDNSGTSGRVRRITPDGRVFTVAGNGNQGFGGDGGPAVNAQFHGLFAITFGPDGSLYIADAHNHRVRRVGPEGTITTWAGNGAVHPFGKFQDTNQPAAQARLNTPVDVAVDPDGNVCVLDQGIFEIVRINTDGSITPFLGGGNPFLAPGLKPLEVSLFHTGIRHIVFARDGTFYFQASGSTGTGHGVWCVNTEGVITLVAGQPFLAFGGRGFGGDEGPATGGLFDFPAGVAVAPDGTLYIADRQNGRVRRVTKAFPSFSSTDIVIPSEDGSVLYQFNASGRHLRTLDALTGVTLLSFEYDSAGRLAMVHDAFNNTTTFQRDVAGNPTAVVGPFGARTTVALDASGWLTRVVNPASETNEITTTASGLVTRFARPNGQASTYVFDAEGRVQNTQDARGGGRGVQVTELPKPTGTASLREIITVTSLQRTNKHLHHVFSDGSERRRFERADGTVTESFKTANEITTNRPPDGSISTVAESPDPRFGMLAPLPGRTEFRTPSGLRGTNEVRSGVQLTNPNDPLSLVRLTNETVFNGRKTAMIYDAATRTFTTTSPAGRTNRTVVDELQRPIESQFASFAPIFLTYDSRGRLALVRTGGGEAERLTRYEYDTNGYLTTIIDPLNRTNRLVRDAAGRVTQQIRPDGEVITSTYDVNGNLASLTPPGRPAHQFTYDAIDQVASYTAPDAGPEDDTVGYTYDLDRALTRLALPDGRSITNDYTAGGGCNCGRLSSVTLERGVIGYDYHPVSGLLTSMTGPDGVNLQFGYDGPLLTNVVYTGAVTGRVSVAFDNDLRVTRSQVNGAHEVTFDYDTDDLLTRAGDLTLQRDAVSGIVTNTVIGNVTESYGVNAFGELTNQVAKFQGNTLFSESFQRDALGRITNKLEVILGETNVYAYTYDTVGRLAEVRKNGAVSAAYQYDANGNRLQVSRGGVTTVGAYDAQDRILSYGPATFTHRASGERTSKTENGQTTTYEYDELGNLLRVVKP